MITYEQIDDSYIEDGSGAWRMTLRISDRQEGIFADRLTAAEFTGAGLDDLTSSGTYTGYEPLEFIVKIDFEGSPDKFKWSKDNGATWEATGVSITGSLQTLTDGVKIIFGVTTGHTLDDVWSFSVMGTVNVFEINDSKKDLDLETGKLAEDEFSFEISHSQIYGEEQRTLYLEVLQFCLDAQNTANKRYVGFFVDRAGQTLSQDNLEFAGVVLPNQQWDDINIGDSEWVEITDVARLWKITCRPFFEDLFSDIEFKDITDKVEKEWNGTDWVTDLTWKTLNVWYRQGYWYKDVDNKLWFFDLVNLNKLLKRLTDIVEQLLANDGKTISIDFDKSTLDGLFRPTRYWKTKVNNDWTWLLKPTDLKSLQQLPTVYYDTADTFITGGGGYLKLGIYEDEIGGDETDAVSPFVHYGVINPVSTIFGMKLEPNSENATELLWANHPDIKNFTDFLYQLALNFGCFLKMYFSSPTQINIEFVSRGSILTNTEVYIKDCVKINGEIEPVDVKKDKKFFGVANYLCIEGNFAYKHPEAESWVKVGTEPKSFEGRRLLLTLSPTQVITKYAYRGFYNSTYLTGYMRIPHNIYVDNPRSTNVILEKKSHYYSPGQHTAIYMKVSPYTANPDDDREPLTDYWTPAGLWQINNFGYNTIASYLNDLYGLEESYYKKALSIECPFLCNFSASVTGSNPHWNLLKLGSKFVYNGINYNVVSITRNYQNKTTQIKLHKSDRFTFGTPIVTTHTIEDIDVVMPLENGLKKGTASGDIYFHQAITINNDRTVSSARSFSSQYGKIEGVSIVECSDGDECYYLTQGAELYSDEWSNYILNLGNDTGTPGQRVYLNKDNNISVSNQNMDIKPIMEKTGTNPNEKDFLCKIGYFTEYNILKIDFSQQWIIK